MGNFTETQMLVFSLIGAANVVLIVAAFIMIFSGRKVDKVENKILAKKVKREPIKAEPEIITDTFEKEEYVEPVTDEPYDDSEVIYHDEDDYEVIDRFEEEQEKTAIISYQELLKAKEEAEKKVEIIDDEKEIVSPIFGTISKPKTKVEASYETNSNHEFLKSLKEFRKNL